MKKYAKALCLGLALAAGTASASVVTSSASLPGDVLDGFDTNTVHVNPGAFTNDWSFALPQTSEFDVNAFQVKFANTYNISGGTLELFSGSVGHGTLVGSSTPLTNFTDGFAYHNLSAGNYYFQVSGVATGARGGKYDLQASISAVPEPSTYALLGIGLVGLIAMRRRQTKAGMFA